MGADVTAGQVVQAYVALHAGRLRASVPLLRQGDDAAVHDARVATRRLRAALSVYRRVLGSTGPLRDELADLGHVLGAARDPHVELRALRQLLADEDPALVVGPIVQRIDEDRSAARLLALDRLEAWLGSSRIDDLIGRLALEPQHDDADLPRLARRAWRRFDRAVEAADGLPAGEARDEALHEVRKAARQARYASEVAVGVVGDPAGRSARRARRVQQTLGAQHESVTRRETLHRLALQADADGESTFTYGRLHALAQWAGATAELDAAHRVARASAPGHRHWMR
ncbi:CHAD domain-containing protein [Cellulomonas sp. ICMP 17802]|uniref:CHAD domain-containing protein n=1 Tax=Cellulomonas sp. ICMP 17802 TaxID=3239199 RepID=UPI00351AEEB2